ncbi:hypothetical protein SAMN05421753_10741 [Planctomicrobium piriforme]|uniref:Uncharacterized protein n=1 Tax=Planctomicrobium piriforme TaxID=1576369 RepID=A0A1I3GL67_9PLAN|nr:hypothetical protein SAMN05421753_10741 [Planctomicrobium piriforme]
MLSPTTPTSDPKLISRFAIALLAAVLFGMGLGEDLPSELRPYVFLAGALGLAHYLLGGWRESLVWTHQLMVQTALLERRLSQKIRHQRAVRSALIERQARQVLRRAKKLAGPAVQLELPPRELQAILEARSEPCIERFSSLHRESGGCERLLQEVNQLVQDPVPHNGIVGVP